MTNRNIDLRLGMYVKEFDWIKDVLLAQMERKILGVGNEA